MDDDDTPGSDLVVIQWLDAAADASQAAAHLVEHGVGAVIDHGAPPRAGGAVLGSEQGRARQILGLAEPTPTGDEDEDLTGYARPWLVPVIVFAVALVVVPLAAFFIAFKLSGG